MKPCSLRMARSGPWRKSRHEGTRHCWSTRHRTLHESVLISEGSEAGVIRERARKPRVALPGGAPHIHPASLPGLPQNRPTSDRGPHISKGFYIGSRIGPEDDKVREFARIQAAFLPCRSQSRSWTHGQHPEDV